MNMNTVFVRAAIATAFVGLSLTAVHVPRAAAEEAASMSVDARAPLHATLLPVLSVFADANNPQARSSARIANDEGLPVTLMPTVYVNARAPAFATMVAPADAVRVVTVAPATPGLPRIESEHADAAPALRTGVMPR